MAGKLFDYVPTDYRLSNQFFVTVADSYTEDGHIRSASVILSQFVKDVSLPEISCSAENVNMGGFVYKVPSKTEFADLPITFYDNLNSDVLYTLYTWYKNTVNPETGFVNHDKKTYTKTVEVYTFNPETAKSILRWTFYNAWITSLGFGSMSYESADIIELPVSISYTNFTLNRDSSKTLPLF